MSDNEELNPDAILKKYLQLMHEIRKREEVIIGLHEGTSNVRYLIVNYEVIFFQLRKILEIIVKSPMLINEEEYRNVANNPENDWRIRDIIKKLEIINPNFYPKSIEIIKLDNQPDEFKTREDGFLTKDELCDAYDYCNTYLHSHNPLKIENELNFEDEWNWVVNILNKIHILLGTHLCHPSDDGNFYYITMENGQGHPAGNFFGKI